MGKERGRERRDAKDSERLHRDDREVDKESSRRDGKERDREKNKENGREEHSKSSRKEKDRDRDREEHRTRRDRDKDEGKEIDRSKEEAVKEEKEPQEAAETKESAKEIEQRILRMREARAKEKASSRRKSVDDVRAWVDKSRKIEKEKEKKRACRSIAEQEEEEGVDEGDEGSGYRSKDLAGMKIRHGLDRVMEGGDLVLTLKDSNILAGDDLNEDVDELENVSVAEQKKREDAYRDSKKKPGVYEDKFQNDMNAVKTMLPQYDDVVKDEGIELDESGGINEDNTKRLEQVRLKLQGAALKVESLLGSANKASDFYTEEEMLKFKKPKKVKKIRKKAVLDVDALEAEAKAAGLGAEDLGSRANNSKAGQELQPDAELRRQTYASAFAKALEESKVLREDKMEVDEDPVAEEEDEMFSRLKKSRELAIKQRAQFSVGPQGVAALLKRDYATEKHDAVDETPAGRTVVITETEEFCLSLQPDEVISRRVAGNDAFGDDEEDGQSGMDIQQEDRRAEVHASADLETEEDDVYGEPPIKEVAVGKGLAGALQLLHERGSLKESVEWGGRNMDKKPSKLIGVMEDEEAPQREINLDRRDEYGRTLTPKEAFRKLSHKFHGKRPGKTKQEKKMKQHEEELKQKRMAAGDTPLRSMEKMRDAQARTNTPYIVMSGHIKPGQTSDPRSGFATVEKEPIGSLTPMLGDKKMEQLLGKRRPGDMGPPPPRKKAKT